MADKKGKPTTASTKSSTKSKSSSKKAKRSGSNVFAMFTQAQIAEYKEAFQMMDHDKDGILNKSDLRATCDMVGKLANEKELDEMVNEAPGPLNFTQWLSLFAVRMQDTGGTDDDTVVAAAFNSFDEEGGIDAEKFKTSLMAWGDRFTQKEINDSFDAMEIDDNNKIDTKALIALLTAATEDED